MILGAHVIVYSTDAEADRAFFRDVLGFPSVDAGRGWLIFGLPGGEVAVHPSEVNQRDEPQASPDVVERATAKAGGRGSNDRHELYLMCDDLAALTARLAERGVATGPVHEELWGTLTHVTLPGGGQLGIYQPKHPVAVGLAAKTS
jgi:catechol 2,3-dioxygenase-like lactoylglutathione lyase family enzyme